MQATRRYWAVVAVALALVAGGVVVERPVLLAGGVGIGAWLLARQYRFTRELRRLDADLGVSQSARPRRVLTGDGVFVTLSLSLPEQSSLAVTAEADPPVTTTGSTADSRTAHLAPGETDATAAFEVEATVAGAFAFGTPDLRIRDPSGFFTETLQRGPTPTVTVDPRVPHDLHVGEGGDRVAVAYGEHESGRLGSGLDPAELRKYVPGDAADRIDWKATARLDDLFVREFEAETDRTTALVVDHRDAMSQGRDGQTKLDYAREAALGLVEYARELDDPLGLYAVGDAGITEQHVPDAGPAQYRTLRRVLQRLDPTAPEPTRPPERQTRSPATARRVARDLDGDGSAFGATLAPYFASSDAYLERIDDDPLFAATRLHLTRLPGSVFTVIVTDDTRRSELREAVKLARRGDDAVLVLLTPTVLFERGGLADLEDAYRRYLDFEEFRRDLARLDRVGAYEVGPGDRLGAILASRRRRRGQTRAGDRGGEGDTDRDVDREVRAR